MTNITPTINTDELTKPEKASVSSSTPVTNKMPTALERSHHRYDRHNSDPSIKVNHVYDIE